MTAGEVWLVDLGMAGKVRPALVLNGLPSDDELSLVTILPHTTALRGNRWEVSVQKPFLKAGAFHLQQLQSVPTIRLLRRLGALTAEELKSVHQQFRAYLQMG